MGRFSIIILGLFLGACTKRSDKILSNRDYDSGDWLLVNMNYEEKTIYLIDSEDVLRKNANNLIVLPEGQCGETTCDGFLRLYRDGKLVEELAYLEKSGLYESAELTFKYSKGKSWIIRPFDKKDFDLKWDSIMSVKGLYPTIYHTQPADEGIILIYELEM